MPVSTSSLKFGSPVYSKPCQALVWIPVVGVGQLSWFWQVVEAVDARAGLAHGLAVKAAAIKVGELLPVVLLILVEVVVVGVHYIIQGFSVGLLRLGSPEEKEQSLKISDRLPKHEGGKCCDIKLFHKVDKCPRAPITLC